MDPLQTPDASFHPDPGPRWQIRFWSIFSGQALSLIGSALTQFVLIWWITDTTGSVSALAFAGIVALLPQALLGPLGGTFADRYSRRLLMIGADAISAVCMSVLIVLFLTDQVALWHLYTMMFIRSTMQAFQAPAATASTAMLVPESFLPRAAGLNQTLYGVMTVAAAPLGALALSLMPIGWALSIDVVTALLAITSLFFFRIPQVRLPQETRPGVWREVREGILYVWQRPGLWRLFAIFALAISMLMPSFSLGPLLVKEHFGGGAPQVALMEGLSGVGMILGGLVIAILSPKRHILWALLGFAASCFAMSLAALAPSSFLWLAVLWWGVSGFTFSLSNAPLTALLQTTVPNQLQGRVFSLLQTVMSMAAPVGLVLATPLGELLGIRWLFVTVGILGGLVSLTGFLSPAVLKLGTNQASQVPTATAGLPREAQGALKSRNAD